MKKEEYLEILTEQIRCKMARGAVAEEMRWHIEDQTEAFLSEGMERKEAEEAAVREMGDPVEVGQDMDRIHRPKMAWSMIALIAAVSVAGYLLKFGIERAVGLEGSGWLRSGRQLQFLLLGLAVMAGICFVDYTRIALRAREILIVFYFCLVTGVLFLRINVNGLHLWIRLGSFGSVGIVPLLCLTVPLYAAVLYRYRGQGCVVAVKALLWMLPALGIALACPSLAALVTVFYSCLIVFAVAVYRKWFRVPVKIFLAGTAAAAAVCPLAGCGYIWFLGNTYQQDRLRVLLQFDFSDGNYRMELVRNILGQSRMVGESAAFAEQAKGLAMSEIMLTGIAGYYGLVAAVLLAAAVVALFLSFLRISLRQRNCLGMLMGCGCTAVLLVQTLVYLAANLGMFSLGSDCPFVSGGGTSTFVTYILLGILLSICRYQNTAPEIRKFAGMFRAAQ